MVIWTVQQLLLPPTIVEPIRIMRDLRRTRLIPFLKGIRNRKTANTSSEAQSAPTHSALVNMKSITCRMEPTLRTRARFQPNTSTSRQREPLPTAVIWTVQPPLLPPTLVESIRIMRDLRRTRLIPFLKDIHKRKTANTSSEAQSAPTHLSLIHI